LPKKRTDPPGAVVVRSGVPVKIPECLGPGLPAHGYLGRHPSNRICPRCRNIQDKLHLGALMIAPVRDSGEQ
jgi:hypothetical protein